MKVLLIGVPSITSIARSLNKIPEIPYFMIAAIFTSALILRTTLIVCDGKLRIILFPSIPLRTPPNASLSPSKSAMNVPTHLENELL